MTAKEMFEKIGFKQMPIKGTVITYCNGPEKIRFYNNRKIVSTNYKEMTLDLLKAIYQQMKELGWLDE